MVTDLKFHTVAVVATLLGIVLEFLTALIITPINLYA